MIILITLILLYNWLNMIFRLNRAQLLSCKIEPYRSYQTVTYYISMMVKSACYNYNTPSFNTLLAITLAESYINQQESTLVIILRKGNFISHILNSILILLQSWAHKNTVPALNYCSTWINNKILSLRRHDHWLHGLHSIKESECSASAKVTSKHPDYDPSISKLNFVT